MVTVTVDIDIYSWEKNSGLHWLSNTLQITNKIRTASYILWYSCDGHSKLLHLAQKWWDLKLQQPGQDNE